MNAVSNCDMNADDGRRRGHLLEQNVVNLALAGSTQSFVRLEMICEMFYGQVL